MKQPDESVSNLPLLSEAASEQPKLLHTASTDSTNDSQGELILCLSGCLSARNREIGNTLK